MCSVMEVIPVGAGAETKSALELRNERVVANQGLVHQLARGFQGRGVPLVDIIQFGNLGLIRAAEKFDEGRGLRFSTYAVYWIRQTIYKGIANTARAVRVPLHARKEVAAFRKTAKALGQDLGRPPWFREVLDAMDLPKATAAKRERVRHAVATSFAKNDYSPLEEISSEASPKDSPAFIAVDEEHREQLDRAMELLSPEHRDVLALRFGLHGSPALGIKATAALIGISWRDARSREVAATRDLRRLCNR